MTDDPDRLRDLVCAACMKHLGTVYRWQVDHLSELHAPKCEASRDDYDRALIDVQFAEIVGDTSALDRRWR